MCYAPAWPQSSMNPDTHTTGWPRSDWRNGVMWWIQSVFVDAAHRRQGVFSALYRHVEAEAQASGNCAGIRLYVEKDNKLAQATYLALGMKDAGYAVMEVEFRETR